MSTSSRNRSLYRPRRALTLLQLALGYNGINRVVGGQEPGRPWRWCPRSALRGRPRHRPVVRTVDGYRDFLAAAGRVDRPGRRTVVHPSQRRTDGVRANLVLWGGWLVVTGAVFSFMGGIVHPYYTVALVPAIAALVGIAVRELWRGREFLLPQDRAGGLLASTGVWAFFYWIAPRTGCPRCGGSCWPARSSPHRCYGRRCAPAGSRRRRAGNRGNLSASAAAASRLKPSRTPTADRWSPPVRPTARVDGPPGRAVLEPETDNRELEALIEILHNRWAAASIGSMTAGTWNSRAGSGRRFAIRWSRSDNSPTLTQFQQYVADHQVRYFIAGARGGPHGRQAAAEITAWVQENFTPSMSVAPPCTT